MLETYDPDTDTLIWDFTVPDVEAEPVIIASDDQLAYDNDGAPIFVT